MDETQRTILDFVRREYFDEDDEDPQLTEKTPLITSGIVDSFSMVSLKTFLERKYSIKIPDEKASAEAFDTVEKISGVVRELTGK